MLGPAVAAGGRQSSELCGQQVALWSGAALGSGDLSQGPSFLLLPELSMNRVGRRSTRRSPRGSSIMQEASMCAKLALG